MMISLDRDEMLKEWRIRRHLPELRPDCIIHRDDEPTALDKLQRDIDDWYLRLLDEADYRLLPLDDIALTATRVASADGTLTAYLPESCRRVLWVKLPGWKRCATIIEGDDSAKARLQGSEYTRGGVCNPVAIRRGNELQLFSPENPTDTRISTLVCVLQPTEGTYVMDSRALELIR